MFALPCFQLRNHYHLHRYDPSPDPTPVVEFVNLILGAEASYTCSPEPDGNLTTLELPIVTSPVDLILHYLHTWRVLISKEEITSICTLLDCSKEHIRTTTGTRIECQQMHLQLCWGFLI